MINLVKFGMRKDASIKNFSPFCLKVETYLKATNTEYNDEICKGNPGKIAPKGKLPFIKHNDKVIADSELIIKYLKETLGINLDESLTEKQIAKSTAITRVLEDHLYWCMLYFRWLDDRGWEGIKEEFFGFLPAPIKLFVPNLVRKSVLKNLWAQGTGRHSKEEVLFFLEEDLRCLNELLEGSPFFIDDKLRTVDIIAYSFFVNLNHEINPHLQEVIRKYPKLIEFTNVVHRKVYH
ncbi:MAG: glutathione S-transferase N-terminal domain-containing protein [Halobacteriovoraceae bacterium]|nr:glutathione S-transferase N-terminal domain-containing protein [Halobacteriovoraceae bacterium]